MIKNYIKIAFRRLTRDKQYVISNIFCLTLGIAACILIALYIREEFSYDRFHEKGDQIYRLVSESNGDRSGKESRYKAEFIATQIPEIEQYVAITPWALYHSLKSERYVTEDLKIGASASTFFDIFSFQLISGSKKHVLDNPNSIVISESLAEKFFKNVSPIGKSVSAMWGTPFGTVQSPFTITGVYRDMKKSHMNFDAIISELHRVPQPKFLPGRNIQYRKTEKGVIELFNISWNYYVVQEDARISVVNKKIQALELPVFSLKNPDNVELQSLTSIHLSGNRDYIYLLTVVAILILGIAVFNNMILATARGTTLAREIVIRKASGATRGALIKQFLGESLVYSLIVVPLAIGTAELVLPYFNTVMNAEIHLNLTGNFLVLVSIVLFVVLTGLIAASYPAVYLSGYNPVPVLKGKLSMGKKGTGIRKGLVIAQFVISSALIIATVTIYRQMEFIQNKNLGFEEEQSVIVDMGLPESRPPGTLIKQKFEQNSNVLQASLSSGVPGMGLASIRANAEWIDSANINRSLVYAHVGNEFVSTMKMNLLAGHEFRGDYPGDLQNGCILNRSAARAYGWRNPRKAIGKRLRINDGSVKTVMGVVGNFHYKSLHKAIEPMILVGEAQNFSSFETLVIKTGPGNLRDIVNSLENTWKKVVPELTFDYQFLDDVIDRLYRSEQRIASLFLGSSFLAILLSFMGLFSLAAYSTRQRTKEIGIRKVFGANITRILGLLTKSYALMVIGAFVIVTPIMIYSLNQWLTRFAYKIEVGIGIFLISGLVISLMALLAVAGQTIKAARNNPSEILREE